MFQRILWEFSIPQGIYYLWFYVMLHMVSHDLICVGIYLISFFEIRKTTTCHEIVLHTLHNYHIHYVASFQTLGHCCHEYFQDDKNVDALNICMYALLLLLSSLGGIEWVA